MPTAHSLYIYWMNASPLVRFLWALCCAGHMPTGSLIYLGGRCHRFILHQRNCSPERFMGWPKLHSFSGGGGGLVSEAKDPIPSPPGATHMGREGTRGPDRCSFWPLSGKAVWAGV